MPLASRKFFYFNKGKLINFFLDYGFGLVSTYTGTNAILYTFSPMLSSESFYGFLVNFCGRIKSVSR